MPKNSAPKPSPAPKAFDVFKPGKSLASPTSRPVIAGQRPPVQDSTLTNKPGKPISNARTGEELMDSHKKVNIAPPPENTSAGTESDTHPTVSEPTADVRELTQPIEPNGEQETKAPVESFPELTSAVEPAASESTPPAIEAITSDPNADALPSEDAAEPETSTSAVDASKVVVSHHKRVGTGRPILKALLVLFILLVLAVAAFDALLDAGIVDMGKNLPHTNFIGQ